MSKVAVIDSQKNPLAPCHPAVARRLLKNGQAAIWRTYPFTIILKKTIPPDEIITEGYTLSWDPGSKISGLAIVSDSGEIVYAAEVHHRGGKQKGGISWALTTRAGFRRGRRTRNLRHRPARWANRKRKVPVLTSEGWKYKPAEDEFDASKDSSKTKNKFVRVSYAQLKDKRYRYTRIKNRGRKEFTPEMTNAVLGNLTRDELIHHIMMRDKKAERDVLMTKTRGFLRNNLKSKLKNIPPTKYRWKRERIGHKERADNGWVPPSLMSRVFNLETWTRRLCKIYPINQLAIENVKFDMQLLENPDIHGIEYQHGTLHGREIREYLLELTGRKCAYCGRDRVRLHIEHIIPKARGGSNRPDNLTMACHDCNEKKGKLYGAELKAKLGEPFAKKVEAATRKSKQGLSNAAAVNTIRWKLLETLGTVGLPVISGTGGKTAYHRNLAGLPKTHYYDAAAVFGVPKLPKNLNVAVIKSLGYGRRDLRSFSVKKPKFNYGALKRSEADGFRKYDHVEIKKQNGKWKGVINCFDDTPKGKPKLRVSDYTIKKKDQRISGRTTELRRIQRRDGYSYHVVPANVEFRTPQPPPTLENIQEKTSTKITTDEITGTQLELLF